MTYSLRLIHDRFDAGASLAMPLRAMNRIVYAFEGSATVLGDRPLETDDAVYSRSAMAITAGGDGATLWRWELTGSEPGDGLATGDGVVSTPMLDCPLTSIDRAIDWLMRCDSVAFPASGCAFTHTHRGPGIRCLQQGSIRIDAEGASHAYKVGEPWFESGPDPVFAQAGDLPTRFIRVSILPASLIGKSSIHYVNAEDRDKPKDQTYRGYVDTEIRKPA